MRCSWLISGPIVVALSNGSPSFNLLAVVFNRSDETLEDRPLDIDAFGAQADLAAIGEDRAHRALDRLVKIAVGEHDGGVLAAEFERNGPTCLGGRLHDRGRPVAVSPVKVMPSTPGCRVRNSPALSGPKPCTTL